MQDHLFRSQAVDARRMRLLGDVVLRQPLGPWLAALLLGACAALVVAFLAWGSYARVETVRGAVALDGPAHRLDVELFVPARAAGFVRVGQVVWVRYDAFPHGRFGSHEGSIEGIGGAALGRDGLPAPVSGHGPFYRARVRLLRQHIAVPDARHPLRPGLLVEADIELERRTLLGWLLAPLERAWARVLPRPRFTEGDSDA